MNTLPRSPAALYRKRLLLAAVLFILWGGTYSSAQPLTPPDSTKAPATISPLQRSAMRPVLPQEMFEQVRADMLNQIPGLDARNAHFFVLVDVSASGGKLFSVYRDFYNFLVQNFFVPGDRLTVMGFTRHLKGKEGITLQNPASIDAMAIDFSPQTAYAAFPDIIHGTDEGTDVLEPVYLTLKRIKQLGLKEKNPIVVLRLADTSTTDFGGHPPKEFFPHNDAQRAEFWGLRREFNSDSEQHPREISRQFTIKGLPATHTLHLTLWYGDNFHTFKPTTKIDRERGLADDRFIPFHRPSISKEKGEVTFTWHGSLETPYVLYLSNTYDALGDAITQGKQTTRARRIALEKPITQAKGQLKQAVTVTEIERGGVIDASKPIFASIIKVIDGQEMSLSAENAYSKTNPPVRVLLVPPRPPLSRWVEWLSQSALILLLSLVLISVLSRPTLHTVTRGDEQWDFRTSGHGLPVIATTSNAGKHEDDHIKVPIPSAQSGLIDREIGVLISHPRLAPSSFRTKIMLATDTDVTADTNDTGSPVLFPGRNDIRFVINNDTQPTLISLTLELADYYQIYRRRLMATGILLGLLVADLTALMICFLLQ